MRGALRKYITIPEAARATGLSSSTLRTWAALSVIPCIKIGRRWYMDEAKLARFLDDAVEDTWTGLVRENLKKYVAGNRSIPKPPEGNPDWHDEDDQDDDAPTPRPRKRASGAAARRADA